MIAVKDEKGRGVRVNVRERVRSCWRDARIERARIGRLAYVLKQSLVGVDCMLGWRIKIGGDLGNVRRAEIIDDALYVAALIQFGSCFKRTTVVRNPDQGGEVAAGGFTPNDDRGGVDSISAGVRAQISDRLFDVLNA